MSERIEIVQAIEEAIATFHRLLDHSNTDVALAAASRLLDYALAIDDRVLLREEIRDFEVKN